MLEIRQSKEMAWHQLHHENEADNVSEVVELS